jgi:CubicO group peptidase (beta-lactamase class C family)
MLEDLAMTIGLQSARFTLTRRSTLALLGGASAAGALSSAALPRVAAANAIRSVPTRDAPRDLMPGGAYDQFLRQQAEQDQFSGSVLLAREGRVVLERAYGMADKARGVPNSPATLFALASVTKTLTATAIMQLAQRGEIAFETTIGAVLGGFPPQVADAITIHQLLTMTSGMDNYYYDPGWLPATRQWSTAAQVLDGTMAFIRERPLLFTPGSQYSYSDSGFVVLGAIVQQISGQDYWTYMRENVFIPAGMTRTDFYTRPQVIGMLASGEIAHSYASQRGGGPRVDVSGNPMFIGLPDGSGGPYTRASDLAAFAAALMEGRLIDRSWLELMLYGKTPLTPRPLDSDPAIQLYFSGYGLEDAMINDRHVLSHSGDGPGITTNLDIYPGLDWTAVVLENYDLTPFGLIAAMSPLVKLERQLITRSS